VLFLSNYTNGLIATAIAISIALIVTKNKYVRTAIIGAGIFLALMLNSKYFYNIWIGMFIPTVIHVYVFTMLFMFYGALKSKSKPGLIAAVLTLVVPLVIIFVGIDANSYLFSDTIKQTYQDTSFYLVNAKLSEVLGLSEGNRFYFYENVYLKIQIFLTFAYTYHYLNWYSKTSVIGWHKNLTRKKTLIITALWIISVGLYWYDYKVGFALLMALSLLHVFAEFPLNVISVKGIIGELRKT